MQSTKRELGDWFDQTELVKYCKKEKWNTYSKGFAFQWDKIDSKHNFK